MAGRATSLKSFSLGQQDEIIIRTKKPASNSSLEIRDNILREYFGFTENDIEAFKRQDNESFCISQAGEKTWATILQVREWRTEPDGKLAIPTSTKIINNVKRIINDINSFRNQRASFEIFKVGMFISDFAVRNLVTSDLEKILLTSGQTRIDAVNNLMVTIASSPSRYEIFQALRFLTNESGYKNNPFLMIAITRTQVFASNTSSFSNSVYDQSLIANAVKSANDNLYSSNPKINSLEAATINQIASRLYDEVHATNKATNRRWIDRFLSMSNAERNSLKEGDIISIAQPDVNSVRGQFPSEQSLQNLNQERAGAIDTLNKIDQVGKDQSFALPGDHRQSEYFQNDQDTFEKEGWKINKQRAGQYRPKVEPTLIPNNYNSYSRANVGADGFGAVIYLYLEGQKFIQFDKRMQAATNYINKKRELEMKVGLDSFHSIPPPPQVTEKYIKDFQRNGRITADPYQKTKIIGILLELERLLEESNAFYRSQK